MDIKPSKDRIVFKLHNPCGLFNQVTCIENAVALSHFLKKDLLIHHIFNKPWSSDIEKGIGIYSANRWYNKRKFVNNDLTPRITDLIDVHPYGEVEYLDKELNIEANVFTQYFYNFSDNAFNEDKFCAGKRKFMPEFIDHYSFKWTLGWYSVFFMNRTPEVEKALSLTKFKPEYQQFAKMIADSLGDFVGAHIRRTDHRFDYATEEQVMEGMATLAPGYPVVVATDDPWSKTVLNTGALVLENYIEKEFSKEFQELKFTDEVTLGLISNLVMCHAKDFIGTQGSTFTGYIQRHVGGNMRLFGEMPYEQTGPYTWNGYKFPELRSAEENKKMNYTSVLHEWDVHWWREWPESKLFPELV